MKSKIRLIVPKLEIDMEVPLGPCLAVLNKADIMRLYYQDWGKGEQSLDIIRDSVNRITYPLTNDLLERQKQLVEYIEKCEGALDEYFQFGVVLQTISLSSKGVGVLFDFNLNIEQEQALNWLQSNRPDVYELIQEEEQKKQSDDMDLSRKTDIFKLFQN